MICARCGKQGTDEHPVVYYWLGGQGDIPLCVDDDECHVRTKVECGRMGGMSTLRKHGRKHYQNAGRISYLNSQAAAEARE